MLDRQPKLMPSLADMLADLGHPSAKTVAKALGISQRTVYHWMQAGCAPRPAMLALFWVTKWGMQWVEADLFNLAQNHMGLSQAMQRELVQARAEIQTLQEQIGRLGRLGEFGSANDPVQGVAGPGPVPASPVACSSLELTFHGFERAAQAPKAKKPGKAPCAHTDEVPRFTKRYARAVGRASR
jgi:hypothetical protein